MSHELTCIRFAEIARAVSPEADPELRLHLGACPSCQAQWAATQQAIEAAKQIPYEAPGPEERARIRNALMFNVARPGHRGGSRRWLQAAAYAAGILGAAGVFAAVHSVAIPWLKARHNETPSERSKMPAPVAPKPEPVIAPLPSLDQDLPKPTPAKAATEKGMHRAAPTRKAAPVESVVAVPAAAEARTPSPAEQAYAEGWEAMRASQYSRAAESMKRAAEATPSSTLAVDARYWESVALARQGQHDKARVAMESFLRRYPGSPRLGEVSVMLGWMLIEAQEWTRAEQLFRAAENDRVSSVRDSARKGLEMVARVQAHAKPAP